MEGNKTVSDYERKIQLKIYRGQCYNNSCVLLAGYLNGGHKSLVSVKEIFDFAEQLYDEGMKRDWINYDIDNTTAKERNLDDARKPTEEPNRFPASTAVEVEDKGTLKNPLTTGDLVI